jgi:hypothetical protein
MKHMLTASTAMASEIDAPQGMITGADIFAVFLRRKILFVAAAGVAAAATFVALIAQIQMLNTYHFTVPVPQGISANDFDRFRRSLVLRPLNARRFSENPGALLFGDVEQAMHLYQLLDPTFSKRDARDPLQIDVHLDQSNVAALAITLRGPLAPPVDELVESFRKNYFMPGILRYFWDAEIQGLERAFRERTEQAQKDILDYTVYIEWYAQQLATLGVQKKDERDPTDGIPLPTAAPSETMRFGERAIGKFVVPTQILMLPLNQREAALKSAVAELQALISIEHRFILRRDSVMKALAAISGDQMADPAAFVATLKGIQHEHAWAAEALEPLQLRVQDFRDSLNVALARPTTASAVAGHMKVLKIVMIAIATGLALATILIFIFEYTAEAQKLITRRRAQA